VFGLRPMDGVACEKTRKERKGRKFGSLREFSFARCASFGFMSHRNHGNHRKISLRLMALARVDGVNRQNRIFLLAYARSDSGRGLRGMLPEARSCLLTQRRHLAPCRERKAIPAWQRYKIFYSICCFFLSRGEGVGCLACGRLGLVAFTPHCAPIRCACMGLLGRVSGFRFQVVSGFRFQVVSGFRFQVSSGFSSSTLET